MITDRNLPHAKEGVRACGRLVTSPVRFTRIVLLASMVAGAACAGSTNVPPPFGSQEAGYFRGRADVLDMGRGFVSLLKAKQQSEFATDPVVIVEEATPRLRSHHRDEGGVIRHEIRITSGLVELLQRLSHAEALETLEPGFLNRTLAALDSGPGKTNAPLPALNHPQAWTLETLNRQASLFSEMTAGLLAIEVAHHTLGHCKKHRSAIETGDVSGASLANVVTPGQWRSAVRTGARQGVQRGFDPDGLQALLGAVRKSPPRPAWATDLVPLQADLSGALSNLRDIEMFYQMGEH